MQAHVTSWFRLGMSVGSVAWAWLDLRLGRRRSGPGSYGTHRSCRLVCLAWNSGRGSQVWAASRRVPPLNHREGSVQEFPATMAGDADWRTRARQRAVRCLAGHAPVGGTVDQLALTAPALKLRPIPCRRSPASPWAGPASGRASQEGYGQQSGNYPQNPDVHEVLLAGL